MEKVGLIEAFIIMLKVWYAMFSPLLQYLWLFIGLIAIMLFIEGKFIKGRPKKRYNNY